MKKILIGAAMRVLLSAILTLVVMFSLFFYSENIGMDISLFFCLYIATGYLCVKIGYALLRRYLDSYASEIDAGFEESN